MSGPANALNINEEGIIYFDGVSIFSSVSTIGTTAKQVLTVLVPGEKPVWMDNPSVVAILSLTGDDAEAIFPVDGNLVIQGGGSGGILFGKRSDGVMFAQVQVDDSTTQINNVGQVEAINFFGNITFVSGSPYTVLETDYLLLVPSLSGPNTILLPDTTDIGRTIIVKDKDNGAGLFFNIIVTTVSGVDLIDNVTSYIINVNGCSIAFTFNGSGYSVVYYYNGPNPMSSQAGGTGRNNVNSTIDLTTNAAIGKIATSDGSGNQTWQDPAASSVTITGDTGGSLTGDSFTFSGGSTGLSFGGTGTTETLSGILLGSNGGTGVDNTGLTITLSSGGSGKILTSDSLGNGTWQTAASGGITTINGTFGSVTGSTISFGVDSGTPNFTGSGTAMTFQLQDSANNLVLGTAVTNVFSGGVTGNVFIGTTAGSSYTTSANGYNLAIGTNAFNACTNGDANLCVGVSAGSAWTSTESNNLVLFNQGVVGDSNTIRIGAQGTGFAQQNKCFIAGITAATVTGAAVLCSTAGQLGTIVSSERFKENIHELKESNILNVRPVSFHYKMIEKLHYGLIAEEVEKVMPELVLYDDEGEISSVAYHEMTALLILEIQKLRQDVDNLKRAV